MVFDRLTREKSTLAVWTKTLKTAPVTIINNNLERHTVYTKNYMSSCSRRVNEIKQYPFGQFRNTY